MEKLGTVYGRPRPFVRCGKNVPGDQPAESVQGVTAPDLPRRSARVVNTAVAGSAEAITLPDILTRSGTVVYSVQPFKACEGVKCIDKDRLALLSHELQHAVQIALFEKNKGGKGQLFLEAYLLSYATNLLLGLKGADAYTCIPFEIEAFAFGNAVGKVLQSERNLKAFNEACCLLFLNLPFEAKIKRVRSEFLAFYSINLKLDTANCKAKEKKRGRGLR